MALKERAEGLIDVDPSRRGIQTTTKVYQKTLSFCHNSPAFPEPEEIFTSDRFVRLHIERFGRVHRIVETQIGA